MNGLIEMAQRGYIEATSADGVQGPFVDGNGDNYPGVRAIKAVNGADAVVKVRNVYGDSSETGFESGTNMTLVAGEIELVTCYQFEVVSGTVRAFKDTNPPT